MTRLVISITSPDRSGIVAGICEGIFASDGNVLSASQTVDQGYFTMIVAAEFGADPDRDALAAAIRENAGEDLHVFVTSHDPGTPAKSTGSPFVLTCIGPDKPGILRSLSRFLSSRGANIDDLNCTVNEGRFVVICDVTVPESIDLFMLQTDLEAAGREGGFTIALQHENIFLETTRP